MATEEIPEGDMSFTLQATCDTCHEVTTVTLPDEADMSHLARSGGEECEGHLYVDEADWPKITEVRFE